MPAKNLSDSLLRTRVLSALLLTSTLFSAALQPQALASPPEQKQEPENGVGLTRSKVRITDGAKTWILPVEASSDTIPLTPPARYFVYSIHTELFPNRYAVAQSKGIYDAFLSIAPAYPDCTFVTIVTTNPKPQSEVNQRARQDDKGPTSGQVYDFIETIKTPLDKLPAFFRTQHQLYAKLTESQKSLRSPGGSGVVALLTGSAQNEPKRMITEFGGTNGAPRYLITDQSGLILQTIKKTGPDGLKELLVSLAALGPKDPTQAAKKQ